MSAAGRLVETLKLAATGFAEGYNALVEAQSLAPEAAKPLQAYGHQAFAGAFTQLKATARSFMNSTEYRRPTTPWTVLGDETFRSALEECAHCLEEAEQFLPVMAKRVPGVLRAWLNDPVQASLVAMQCDTAVRMAKMGSARAA